MIATNRVLSFKAMAHKIQSLARVRLLYARALRERRTRDKVLAAYLEKEKGK